MPLNSASVNTGFAHGRLTESKSIPVITNRLYIEHKILLLSCSKFTALRNQSTKGRTSETQRPLETPEAGPFLSQRRPEEQRPSAQAQRAEHRLGHAGDAQAWLASPGFGIGKRRCHPPIEDLASSLTACRWHSWHSPGSDPFLWPPQSTECRPGPL